MGLNPLLSEAGFSTHHLPSPWRYPPLGLNPLLSEAGFSTRTYVVREVVP